MESCFITNTCAIIDTKVYINDQCDFEGEQTCEFIPFIKSAYKYYNIGFPKFYKMDNLAKLAFMSSELLLRGMDIQDRYKPLELGIVLVNSSSTLDTDDRYFKTIIDKSNYFPSPAVFVYTLPNIMVGEISIRNKIMGENITFVAEKYDPPYLYDYVNILLSENRIRSCICGWVEFDREGSDYESFLYLIEREDFTGRNIKFTPSFLEENYRDLKV